MVLDAAYLFLRVSRVQCLTSLAVTGSPFPSHPTGRSVFPNPAVRQSSSHSMHRLTRILDDSAPDVDDASGIQSRIRVFLPPETSTFATVVQVSAKANVDEALQAAKCLACVGVAEVSRPSPHRLIHLLNKLCGRYRRPPLGEELNPPPDIALRRLAGKDINARLAALGRTTLHELEPDEVEPIGQLRDPGLFPVDRQPHARRDPGKRLQRLFRAASADQDCVISIAV